MRRVVGVVSDAGTGVSIAESLSGAQVVVEATWLHPDAFDRAPGRVVEDGVKRIVNPDVIVEFRRRPW